MLPLIITGRIFARGNLLANYRLRNSLFVKETNTWPVGTPVSSERHYGGKMPKFCIFHKRGWLPLSSVEHTKLRSCTSVGERYRFCGNISDSILSKLGQC